MGKSLQKYWPVFLLPTFLAFTIGFIVPFILGLWLSFCEFTAINNATFVGVKNFARIFSDFSFTYSFGFTTLFTIVSVLVINVLAFSLALVLTKGLRGTNIFRTVFFLPNLIGGIVLGHIWKLIFDGILARFDQALNLNEVYGFWGLVILVSWQQIGYMMIIYIAGLQTIPIELNEAADMDGANAWQRLRKVTIPMCMPAITICTFLTVTNGFKLFDQNLALTGGEPSHRTEMLALNIYDTFYSRVGYEGIAQAKAVLFFVMVVGIGLLQLWYTRRKEIQH